MLADSSFKPGPPKKKAHKVLALAPLIRSLRTQGRTWPAIAEVCKTKGLVVTPKTVREVMRDLDGPSSRSGIIGVMQTVPNSKPTKTATSRRKSHNTPKRKSAGKLQRTPRERPGAATVEDHAHTNGRVRGTNGNLQEEDGVAPHRNNLKNDRAPNNGDGPVGRESREPTPALASPPEAHVDVPAPVTATAAPKRRFGAKGIER